MERNRIMNLDSVRDAELDQYDGVLATTKQPLLFYGFSRDSLKGPYSSMLEGGIEVRIEVCRVGNKLKISLKDPKGEIFGLISQEVVQHILAWPKAGKEE